MRLLHWGARQQEALHQERERGGGGVARDRIRHRGHEGAGAVWGQQVQCQLQANLFTQYYTCQIIPLSAKRWNFNILYIFISIPEKVWPDLIFNDHTMPEHLSDLAICSRCGQTGREARRSAASVTLSPTLGRSVRGRTWRDTRTTASPSCWLRPQERGGAWWLPETFRLDKWY